MGVVSEYYNKILDLALSPSSRINVASTFHGQIKQINKVLDNDATALISTILNFMIGTANVSISFDGNNSGFNKLLLDWTKSINKNVAIDIPQGLRSFTEQYFRERWKSSLIVLRIKWAKKNGFLIPSRMWIMDGGSIYAHNDLGNLNSNEYYFGRADKEKKSNLLTNTETETVIVRKPYNSWYDIYPTPYLKKSGALYHALFKLKLLDRQAEFINTAFPYQFLVKMGCEEAMRRHAMPGEQDFKDMQEKFKNLKGQMSEHAFAKGFGGAVPFDVNFEELIPNYLKALDEKIHSGSDKKLLSALGLIELQGFSSNRTEMILNPKVLVSEIEDAVLDYVELLQTVVDLIKDKNSNKYTVNDTVEVSPGVIKAFLTDEMKTLIRSWYDRGLISMEDALEDTTPLNFKTQTKKRDNERREQLHIKHYPRITQNVEPSGNPDTFPDDEDLPDDKKKNTPEVKNYRQAEKLVTCQNCKVEIDYTSIPEKGMGYIACPNCGKNIDQTGKCYNASEETECITEPMKTVRSIPNEIRHELSKEKQQIFKQAFNEAFENATKLEYDNFLREKTAMEYAVKKVLEYVEAPYKTNKDLPKNIRNSLPSVAQTVWRTVFNESLKNGDSEEVARKKAWSAVKNGWEKNSDGKWVKK